MIHVHQGMMPNAIGNVQGILERQIFSPRRDKLYNQLVAVDLLSPSSGITQLTGDVTAGPGSGSQAATVVPENASLALAHRSFNRYQAPTVLLAEQIPPGGTTTFLRGDGTYAVPPGTAVSSTYPYAFTKPVFANYTTITQTGGSFTDQTGNSKVNGIYLKGTTNSAAHKLDIAYKTAPASNHAVDFGFSGIGETRAGITFLGVGFRSSVTNPGRLLYVGLEFSNGAANGTFFSAIRMTDPTTFSSQPLAATAVPSAIGLFGGGFTWLRAISDGTNLKFYYSADGVNFDDQIYTETIAAFLGSADQVFWGIDPFSDFASMTLVHYLEN